MTKPPVSICPIDGSPDIDIKDGVGYCPHCQSTFEYRVRIDVQRWNPMDGMNLFQKVWYYTKEAVATALTAFKQVWCVHEWEMRTIDAWEDELFNDEYHSVGSLRTVVSNMPPYFICKHCNKHIQGKITKG